ncbi:DMT family transporter [Thermomonospora echinospora]|nr:DMT family transporter [Thermomonospora echinospora]
MPMAPSRTSLGTTLCLISAAGFGMSAVFAKETYQAGAGVQTMLTVRFALAALLFWALVAWRRPAFPAGRTLLTCVGLGAVGYACQATFYFGSLARIDGSLAALLLYTFPPIVTVIAIALGRESMDRRRLTALACSVLGVLLLLGSGVRPGAAGGVALALAAACTYALYLTVANGLPEDLDLYLVSAIVCTSAAVSLALISVSTGSWQPPAQPDGWLWTGLLAVFSTFVPIICMLAGMRVVGASTAAIVSYAEPAVTVASTALVYGERLAPTQFLGGAVVLVAVLILSSDRAWPSPALRRAFRRNATPALTDEHVEPHPSPAVAGRAGAGNG